METYQVPYLDEEMQPDLACRQITVGKLKTNSSRTAMSVCAVSNIKDRPTAATISIYKSKEGAEMIFQRKIAPMNSMPRGTVMILVVTIQFVTHDR